MSHSVLSRTLALCLSLAPLALASAQTKPPIYVFTTVDSIDIQSSWNLFRLTGILQGESTPRTIEVGYSNSPNNAFERCERLALLAMNKPGRYLFELRQDDFADLACKLTRVP